MKINLYYQNIHGGWSFIGEAIKAMPINFKNQDIVLSGVFSNVESGITKFEIKFESKIPTRIKLAAELAGDNPYHLIPCCIYGDNNLKHAKADQYPNLTREYPESIYSSSLWEYRADRAALPVSILFTKDTLGAISVAPYSQDEDGQLVRNGVFAELDDLFGITIGYANLPKTFVNKRCGETQSGTEKSTNHSIKATSATGYIFDFAGGAKSVSKVLNFLYCKYREIPAFENDFATAARAILDTFVEQNYSAQFHHYTNQASKLPENIELKPWRGVYEIAWTGGVILGYPFIQGAKLLDLPVDFFAKAKCGYTLFDEVANSINPDTGLFYDLTYPLNGSRINGWWIGVLGKDTHCAYTNGQALYYLFKLLVEMKKSGEKIPANWEKSAILVANSFCQIQREDGCCGYTFSPDKLAVVDFEGFGGCWIGVAFAVAAEYTGECKFLEAAKKAADYYYDFVKSFNCYGTPMDTWKAPEQEGNLAFLKLARSLHEQTNHELFLTMLEDGATYEYTWRYGFKAIPEILPLKKSNWNSCGGSVTSVSNPHIHPMGLIATSDLYYLGEKTNNKIHIMRAQDGVAFAMNCLELYPNITGYGRYGVSTERYCPSDGLTIETYGDGRNASMWFSYNAWAAANMLEGILWMIENNKTIFNDNK